MRLRFGGNHRQRPPTILLSRQAAVARGVIPVPKNVPNPTDRHVGSRVRMRRMMVGMSQEKLGDALGLTFQQIQKYEKGTNRMGASRLHQIAKVLKVPISYLFEGGPDSQAVTGTVKIDQDFVSQFLSARESIALMRAFVQIDDPKIRRSIVAMIESVAAAG
jgi:transcriptional regulator with XRE-family HTH domain